MLLTPTSLRRCADTLRADARAFMSIAASLDALPHYLSFGPTLLTSDREHYEAMADKRLVAAEQAETMAAQLEAEERARLAALESLTSPVGAA